MLVPRGGAANVFSLGLASQNIPIWLFTSNRAGDFPAAGFPVFIGFSQNPGVALFADTRTCRCVVITMMTNRSMEPVCGKNTENKSYHEKAPATRKLVGAAAEGKPNVAGARKRAKPPPQPVAGDAPKGVYVARPGGVVHYPNGPVPLAPLVRVPKYMALSGTVAVAATPAPRARALRYAVILDVPLSRQPPAIASGIVAGHIAYTGRASSLGTPFHLGLGRTAVARRGVLTLTQPKLVDYPAPLTAAPSFVVAQAYDELKYASVPAGAPGAFLSHYSFGRGHAFGTVTATGYVGDAPEPQPYAARGARFGTRKRRARRQKAAHGAREAAAHNAEMHALNGNIFVEAACAGVALGACAISQAVPLIRRVVDAAVPPWDPERPCPNAPRGDHADATIARVVGAARSVVTPWLSNIAAWFGRTHVYAHIDLDAEVEGVRLTPGATHVRVDDLSDSANGRVVVDYPITPAPARVPTVQFGPFARHCHARQLPPDPIMGCVVRTVIEPGPLHFCVGLTCAHATPGYLLPQRRPMLINGVLLTARADRVYMRFQAADETLSLSTHDFAALVARAQKMPTAGHYGAIVHACGRDPKLVGIVLAVMLGGVTGDALLKATTDQPLVMSTTIADEPCDNPIAQRMVRVHNEIVARPRFICSGGRAALSHAASVRAHGPANVTTPSSIDMDYMREFVAYIADDVTLRPADTEEWISHLSGPRAREVVNDDVHLYDAPSRVGCFAKVENIKSGKPPRLIIPFKGAHNRQLAQLALPVEEHLKATCPWYTPGTVPATVAHRVNVVARAAADDGRKPVAYDATNYDATNVYAAPLLSALFAAVFKHRDDVDVVAVGVKALFDFAKQGGKLEDGLRVWSAAVASGCRTTTVGNTVSMAFIVYRAFRESGMGADAAYSRLCERFLVNGDDTFGDAYGVDVASSAADLGYTLRDEKLPGGAFVYAGRWFPDPANDPGSTADVPRRLSGIHSIDLKGGTDVRAALVQRAAGWRVTDADTFLVGDYARAVLGTREVALDARYFGQYEFDRLNDVLAYGAWPKPQCGEDVLVAQYAQALDTSADALASLRDEIVRRGVRPGSIYTPLADVELPVTAGLVVNGIPLSHEPATVIPQAVAEEAKENTDAMRRALVLALTASEDERPAAEEAVLSARADQAAAANESAYCDVCGAARHFPAPCAKCRLCQELGHTARRCTKQAEADVAGMMPAVVPAVEAPQPVVAAQQRGGRRGRGRKRRHG